MYPDWPQTAADLVPQPQCDGPKLAAFDFKGPQDIEFIEYIGEGLHAHVMKVKIKGQEYALKLFRFVYDHDWYGPGDGEVNEDRATLTLMGQYSEPFNSECRAFGRLHETGHQGLAMACYGYVLLDEAHERSLTDRFALEFNGDIEQAGRDDMRGRYLGERSGKPPPIRGILKELGTAVDLDDPPNLTVPCARRVLRDTIQLQQLGIFSLDMRRDQLIDNRFCDFSTAITVPHFLTNPELNPKLTPNQKAKMEREAFLMASNDYWNFEELLILAMENPRQTSNLLDKVTVFPGGVLLTTRDPEHRKLRSASRQPERVYTLVDPRRYGPSGDGTKTASWKIVKTKGMAKTAKRKQQSQQQRYKITSRPERWYYECAPDMVAKLLDMRNLQTTIRWYVEDNHIFLWG